MLMIAVNGPPQAAPGGPGAVLVGRGGDNRASRKLSQRGLAAFARWQT